MNIQELEVKAKEIRRDIIAMLGEAGSGHPGGSLSAADIVTALYFSVLRIDPGKPSWKERDRFVLSKGHACPLLYSALAERGCFPKEELMTLRKMGSRLQGHPKINSPPGVEISSGSLGQGLSVGDGMALAGKLDKKDYRVYVLLGDGEIEEGQVWEAAMSAAHYKLDNLCAILDFNGLQIDGPTKEVMDSSPIREKWTAFRWHTLQIDGHNFKEILSAFEEAKRIKGKPTIIIAKTIKGKGVSFMENVVDFHGVAPTKEEAKKALEELS
jgi:transketolase